MNKKILITILILTLSVLIIGCQDKPQGEVINSEADIAAEENNDSTTADEEKVTNDTEGVSINSEDNEEVEEVVNSSDDTGSTEEVILNESETNNVEETSESESETHVVDITTDGFDPQTITIDAGDTVKWNNVRTSSDSASEAFIIGSTGPCRSDMKTPYPPGIQPGESWSHTLNESGRCKYIDGIRTKQTGFIEVE